MRGVFFVLFCLISIFCGETSAAGLGGEVSGLLGADGIRQQLNLWWQKDWESGQLDLGVDFELAEEIVPEPKWYLEISETGREVVLRAGQNVDHHTSRDLFRLIGKNQYVPQTAFALVETTQVTLGLFKDIPLRSGRPVDAAFTESCLQLGPATINGFQLWFSGPGTAGAAGVVQGTAAFGPFEAAAAAGWLKKDGETHTGTVFELKYSGQLFEGTVSWQNLSPGFTSLLAKSNRYTPNRVGWQVALDFPAGPFRMGLDFRHQTSWAGTREYLRQAYTLQFGENWSMEWRREPTRTLVLRRETARSLWQIDFLNMVFRHDWTTDAATWSLRADAVRRIARIELQLKRRLTWRLITKYDFQRHLAHAFLRIRLGEDGQNVQLEVGQYDGGNLATAFGQPLGLRLSWNLRF